MAAWLLTRSKTLTLTKTLARDGGFLRALSTLRPNPAASSPAVVESLTRRSPLTIPKILGYDRAAHLGSTKVLSRWFSTGAPQASNSQIHEVRKTVTETEHIDTSDVKEGASPKVLAFSPLEGVLVKERKSELTKESAKVKQHEILNKVTYAMIPALLLVSKNSVSTSLLVGLVFYHTYMFNKEVLVDYVHHEITRKWVLIYFKLLLLILAKDLIVYFNFF